MSQNISPSFAQKTLPELDAGIFEEKFNRTMKNVAIASVVNDDGRKKGKVTIEFTFERIGKSNQVNLTHKFIEDAPTSNGKRITHDETSTPLYVNTDGSMTVVPDKQPDLLKSAQAGSAGGAQ